MAVMTEEMRGYQRALDHFETVVRGVPPDGWTAPSPCAAWSARDVAGHMIGGQYMIRALATGTDRPELNDDPGRFARGDPLRAWRSAREECAAALTPGALERAVPMGHLGDVPLRDFLGGYVLEVLIHTWDLAQATGQPSRLDPELVHRAFATAQVIGPTLHRFGFLGPELTAPRGSDEQTRLLAFLGRTAVSP
jgi:uncharacterized protein (TIGR03086 family)